MLLLQPSKLAHCPAPFAGVAPTVLEHEGVHLLAMDVQHLDSTRASSDEVTHGLMTFIGNPDRRELAGPPTFSASTNLRRRGLRHQTRRRWL